MQKTVVINVVGLTPKLLGEFTPFLTKWSSSRTTYSIKPELPAVTCSAQATYLTGASASQHGIVGNGWYFPIFWAPFTLIGDGGGAAPGA